MEIYLYIKESQDNKGGFMIQKLTLKDAHYHVIGYVEIKENGDKTLKDSHYHIKGYYIASNDVTKDEHYHIVAHGDVLTSLL